MSARPEDFARHTPGPWAARRATRRFAGRAEVDSFVVEATIGSGKQLVARLDGPFTALPVAENMRLIAAAPDLLIALTLANETIAKQQSALRELEGQVARLKAWREEACDAMAEVWKDAVERDAENVPMSVDAFAHIIEKAGLDARAKRGMTL